MTKADRRPGEFQVIKEIFSPLSQRHPDAFALSDDVAMLAQQSGQDIVLKTDAIVEGVHFHKSDPPESIAKKALRVNISDFAAKGASPSVYLLALVLPDWPDSDWLQRFAHGLSEDQAEFGVTLVGGDTNSTPGALTLAVMMTGFVPQGKLIRRSGAMPGDIVFVTGTIGDAGAGLALLKKKPFAANAAEEHLISRYRIPCPRLAFGRRLRGLASAALDVSDGLIGDLSHIAEVSGVRIEVQAQRIPLSAELVALHGDGRPVIAEAATAGDDYEIAFTAPASLREHIEKAASDTNTPVTAIGRVFEAEGVALLDERGQEIKLDRFGYTHF
jgi:thiamine-monophosphate kinase